MVFHDSQSSSLISTHTSLAGRDLDPDSMGFFGEISTHTSLAGRDGKTLTKTTQLKTFLLTRPSRDVTVVKENPEADYTDFYSHVPRGT